jgi:hypothetical protein
MLLCSQNKENSEAIENPCQAMQAMPTLGSVLRNEVVQQRYYRSVATK